jgi:hypothetical protein
VLPGYVEPLPPRNESVAEAFGPPLAAEHDGRGTEILIRGPTVEGPAGVAPDGPVIYWASHANNAIAAGNLRGLCRRTDPVRRSAVHKPRGLGVWGDQIYWANQDSSEIKEVDLEGHGLRTEVVGDAVKRPRGLAVTGG